jgi:hypothetical protein
MADQSAHRRAARYRSRAHSLTENAQREPFQDRRRYMLDVAASYRRAADQMAPPPQEKTLVSRGTEPRYGLGAHVFSGGRGTNPDA